jgi:predicted metal-dependent phosphoesterase TrpH
MRFDLHIHSSYSRDASASPKEVLRYARKIGLDGIAITDHNEVQGSKEALALAKEAGVLLIRGVEVSAQEGHVLAYGVADPIPKGLRVQETIERIRSAGGIAVAAHPKRFPSGMGLEAARSGKFDAIEVLNGGSSARSNRLARKVAEEISSPLTAGSDAHELDQVGKCYTMMDGASSEEDVLASISKGLSNVGGRNRTRKEGLVYSVETLIEWLRGDFRRL